VVYVADDDRDQQQSNEARLQPGRWCTGGARERRGQGQSIVAPRNSRKQSIRPDFIPHIPLTDCNVQFEQLGLDGAALPAHLPTALTAKAPSGLLVPALRATCVAGMLGCNAAMTSCYVQALQASGSVPATLISAAVNFVLSGVAGWAIFQEALSLRWWAGAGLTLMGVALVAGWGFEQDTRQEPEGRPRGGRYHLRDRTPRKAKAKGS
jgi:hypothetical protein